MRRISRPYPAFRHLTLVALVLSAIGICLPARIARADLPEDATRYKAGRIMFNLRGGGALGLVNTGQDVRQLGAAGIDFGVAMSSDNNAYLVVMPQVDLLPGFYNIMVPIGFQYDIRLFGRLYLYPRVSLGYSVMISTSDIDLGQLHLSASQYTHGGVGIPELGLKYVVGGRFNIGIEPVSVPIFFTGDSYAIWYRMMAIMGGTF